jgi:predicted nucleic acid-binding protein
MPAAQVLDSHALLKLLRDEPGAETVTQILEKAGQRDQPVHMTEVDYAEVQYMIRRKHGNAAWKMIAAELIAAPIQFHPADRPLADSAADFKARFRISLADAFAAALAKQKKAELVTGDPEFKPLESEIRINWLKLIKEAQMTNVQKRDFVSALSEAEVALVLTDDSTLRGFGR